MTNLLQLGLYICGIFTLTLGIVHFAFPQLLDFDHAIPKEGPPLKPFRLWPIHYATTRQDVRGIAWVMNHAASYGLVSIGLFDLFCAQWWGAEWAQWANLWIVGWWLLRAGTQLALGHRRGDWLILLGFMWLAVWHGLVAAIGW